MRSRRLAAYAAALSAIPAPPVAHYAYGLDPNVTTGTGAKPSAYTYTDTQTVYLPDRGRNPMQRFQKAHETGHLFMNQVLTDGDRQYFSRLLHAPGQWGVGQGADDPAEVFADYYGAAASGINPAHGYSVPMYVNLGPKRMKRFERAMERLSRRHHLKPYKG